MRAFGLVVWFSLRVREVPSSILGMPQFCVFSCFANWKSIIIFVILTFGKGMHHHAVFLDAPLCSYYYYNYCRTWIHRAPIKNRRSVRPGEPDSVEAGWASFGPVPTGELPVEEDDDVPPCGVDRGRIHENKPSESKSLISSWVKLIGIRVTWPSVNPAIH